MADSWQAIDANERGSLTAVSSVDDKTIVRLVADPATGALLVSVSGGIATGTWYKVNGVIDGNNKTFTIATAVGSDFMLILARQPQALTIGADTWDYSYSVGGGTTTITYVVAPDASLSGQPHQAYVIS